MEGEYKIDPRQTALKATMMAEALTMASGGMALDLMHDAMDQPHVQNAAVETFNPIFGLFLPDSVMSEP